MAGGIGPPRDSTRRALVGTAENESSRTKPWKIWKKAPRALSHPSFGLGPYPVLDNRRSGKQAGRFQDLFQPSSRAYCTLGPTTRGRTAATDREAPIVPMGISWPKPVSNTDSCLTPQLRFLTPSLDQQRSFAELDRIVARHS